MGASSAALPALVASVFIFVALALTPLRRHGQVVELHANGVVVTTRRMRDTVFFDDVDEVWFEIDMRNSGWGAYYAQIDTIRLVGHDRVVHRVPLIVGEAVEAANWILRHCSNHLLDDARGALRAGETLTFADVRIDRQGITFGKRAPIPWTSLRLVRMQPGSIRFYQRTTWLPWRTIRIDRVPHPTVLTTLVRELAPRVEIDDPLQKGQS